MTLENTRSQTGRRPRGIGPRALVLALLASLIALPAAAAEEEPLTPYQWQQQQKAAFDQSEKVYADALKRNGLLAQYKAMRDAYRADKNKAFRVVFGQYLSWYQTYVGDYVGAHDSYSIRQLPAADDAPSPLTAAYRSRPALETIAELARGRKAIFLNEAHNVPLTRTLTVQLLPKLRAEGYTHFAAETLYAADAGLQERGYPVPASGFYTMEPIYSEMVRTALKLGFKVVAYESENEGNGDVREHDQAKNLYERVFKLDPDARLVVNAGYAHIQKNGKYLGGRSMAQHFQKLSGIDPLTVEQTMLLHHPTGTEDHPYYTAAIEALHPSAPIVFEGKDGKPWALKPKAYDVSVLFPPEVLRNERPTWLGLGGMRVAYSISGSQCQGSYPCLIEARYADEGADAIPADRLVLDPLKGAQNLDDRLMQQRPDPASDLYLRPGSYRVTGLDANNRLLFRQNVVVGDKARPASGAAGRP